MDVEVTWGAISVLEVQAFRIHRSDNIDFIPDDTTVIATVGPTETNYVDVSPLIPASGSLYYRVEAVRSTDSLVTKVIIVFDGSSETTVTVSNVLNWPRSNGRTYEEGPDHSSTDGWSLSSNDTLLRQSQNSSVVRNIYSPEEYNNYTIKLKLYSTSTDDDWIGLVGAGKLIDGNINYLTFMLGRDSNMDGGKSDWCAVFGDETNDKLGDEIASAPIPTPVSSGWAGVYIYMQIERMGNTIKAYVSDWDSDTIDPSTEIVVTASDLPRKGSQLLDNPSSYGFSTYSQSDSYWEIM